MATDRGATVGHVSGFAAPDILGLQRSLGNRGVGQFLARYASVGGSVDAVQRCGAIPCNCPPGERAAKEAAIQRSWWDDAAEAAGEAGSAIWDAAATAAEGALETGAGLLGDAAEGAAGLLGAATGGGGPGPAEGGGSSGGAGKSAGGVPALPVLRAGATGAAVTALQERLGALGFAAPVSGVFDAATAAAVEAFQTAAGLVADGIVGALTWAGIGQAPVGGGAAADVNAPRLNNPRGGAAEDSGVDCQPFASKARAEEARDSLATTLLPATAAMFGGAVSALWRQYLFGGAGPQEITDGGIIQAFATSGTSVQAGALAVDSATKAVEAKPELPDGTHRLDQLIDPGRRLFIEDGMDYDIPGTTAGNIAGGIGRDQTSVQVGAQPSPFNDSRNLGGVAVVTTLPNGTRQVVVRPRFTVFDTMDLCPGNKGSPFERFLTVPMSRCEASGISGDVPYRVAFATAEGTRFVGGPPPPEPDVPDPGGP
jgi:peptidoglycan hydrolase-like protein with peptidoglycan-binding domain